jgi:hypothetical protein
MLLAGRTESSQRHLGDDTTSAEDVRAEGTLLGAYRRPPRSVAALMASDMAIPLTAVVVNVACGEIAD